MAEQETTIERVVMRALWDVTENRIRYRARTRLAVFDDVRRLWSSNGSAEAPANETIEEELIRLIGKGYVDIDGPTNKRVRLSQAGKDYAVELLGVTPPKSPT